MARYSDKQRAALETLMRDDVYRQATEIIKAEGLQALTMDRLAKRVGVSRGTLYNYFADRDALVDYIEDRTFAPLLDAIEVIADGDGTPPAKLDAMAHEIFRQVYDNRVLVVAMTPEKHNEANLKRHFERRRLGLGALERTIRQGIDSGEFRNLPPGPVSEIFFAVVAGLIDHMVYSGEFRKPDEAVPTLMEVVLGGLKSGSG